jgi:hypothetical protein
MVTKQRESLMLGAVLPILVAGSAFAADLSLKGDNICHGAVDHVLLEEGHRSPPTMLIPDQNSDSLSAPQGWNFLYSDSSLPDVTVHCFNKSVGSESFSVVLDRKYKRCTFWRNRLACQTPGT